MIANYIDAQLYRILGGRIRTIFAIFLRFNINVIKIEIYIIVDVAVIRRIIVIVHVIVQCPTQLQQVRIAGVGIVIQLSMAASGGRCGGRDCRYMRVIVVQSNIRIGIE